MDTRRRLAVGCLAVLLVLAGCSAAGSLDMQPAGEDARLAELTSRSTEIPDEGPTRGPATVAEVIEDGSATTQGLAPVVEPGLPFAHDGRYYNVSWTVVGTEPGVRVDVAIDYNGTAPENETIAYGRLPARDRDTIDQLLPQRRPRLEAGYDFGVGGTYNASQRDRSVLLTGEYSGVRYDGKTYPVRVEDVEDVTIRTYRYSAAVVANSTAEYADQVRDEYLFELPRSELSDGERNVVTEAIDGSYYADSTDDEAFRSVMERFRGHEAVESDDYHGTWLVRYDGSVYLAELSYGGFDDP